jgi:hypothetical protein
MARRHHEINKESFSKKRGEIRKYIIINKRWRKKCGIS